MNINIDLSHPSIKRLPLIQEVFDKVIEKRLNATKKRKKVK